MSTAKRKKRSSSLKGSLNPSKRHRDRFNVELDNLAKLLPFPNDVIQKLDKLSILRLSASYLRAKNFFKEQHWTDNSEQSGSKALARTSDVQFEGNGVFSRLLLEALDGFVIVLTQDFELFYASETIQEYLGLSQASVIHQDFMRFIHVDDHELIKKNLQPHLDEEKKIKILDEENDGDPSKPLKSKDEDKAISESGSLSKEIHTERSFICRMKCILNTSAGFFKPFKCNGRLREMTLPDKDKKEYGLFLICTPMETMTNSILEIRLKTSLFCSKNRMDLSFVDIDQKGRALLGYHKRDIALQSSYCMIHFEDIAVLKHLHVDLMSTGKCQGTFRLLNKNLKWQWLTGTAQVVFKGNEADFVITTNRPLSDEEGEEVLRQRGQQAALPFVANDGSGSPKEPPYQYFYDKNKPQPQQEFKFPGAPPRYYPGNKKVPDAMPGNGRHPCQHGYSQGQATSLTDGSLSPQANLSSFPEDGFSSTACTSAPASPDDLDLGVDFQDELMTDPPDLTFLSQDFPLQEPESVFFDPNKDNDLIDHMSQLVMDPNPLGDLPTLEETIALVQDVISNGSQSTPASVTSPEGSFMSSRTPPHVNCDPFSPTSSIGQPSPFLSPASSQVGAPTIPSPSGVPTPDPSPLGGRHDGEQARVNISWQGAPNNMNNPMLRKPMNQPKGSPYGSCSPNYPINPPNGNVVTSKSAYLASVQKRERENYQSCVGNPQAKAWSRMQPQYNQSANQANMNSYQNWNSGSCRPLSHMQEGGHYQNIVQNNDPSWGQANHTVPPFEDTLPNLDYPRTNILSPPYQDEAMSGFGYNNSHVPVTTMPSTKLGGW